MTKTTKLHEILAVEGDLGQAAAKITSEAQVTFSKKADHFMGLTKSVKMLDVERGGEDTRDTKAMVTTVGAKLGHVSGAVARYLDAVLCKESANQAAVADVVIDGKVLIAGAPATFLLGMEGRLKELRKMYDAIPTLQPGIVWVEDLAEGDGVYRQAEPAVGFKTEKTIKSKVMVDPTKEHPAQVREWSEDVPVARVESIATSGMLTPANKSRVLERLDVLLRAFKQARQRANTVEVPDVRAGRVIMDFINGDLA